MNGLALEEAQGFASLILALGWDEGRHGLANACSRTGGFFWEDRLPCWSRHRQWIFVRTVRNCDIAKSINHLIYFPDLSKT
jgi:hypothetical protein